MTGGLPAVGGGEGGPEDHMRFRRFILAQNFGEFYPICTSYDITLCDAE